MTDHPPPARRPAFTLLELLVVLAILAVLLALLLAAVQGARQAAARADCQSRLRQLAVALHQHHEARGALPAGMTYQDGGAALLLAGWELHLLPFVEQAALHEQALADYRRTPAVKGPPPHAGLSAVVAAFLCPGDPRVRAAHYDERDGVWVAFTSYLGVCGRDCLSADGVLYRDSQTRFADVSDGLSNTLLLGERPPSHDLHLGWWYAGRGQGSTGSAEMLLGVREPNLGEVGPGSPCGPGFYAFGPSRLDDPCGVFHFWSPHPGGAHFAFADGSVRFLAYSANDLLPALASRAGGEPAAQPD
jgi:prepilin-type N-terminal cleavage/methylation domain-containing protein/prepilin-type processing-associated H-X9-DG protein